MGAGELEGNMDMSIFENREQSWDELFEPMMTEARSCYGQGDEVPHLQHTDVCRA